MLSNSRLVHQLATLATAIALTTAAVACGTTQATTEPQGPKTTEPAQPPTEDVVFSDYEKVEVNGVRFVPEGFGYPGMVKVTVPAKVTLDKQRKKLPAAKPAEKGTDTKILVTLLWDAAQADKSPAKTVAKPLYEEARTALLDLQAKNPDQVDEVILTMLFTAELWLDNSQGAMNAANELLNRFPTSKSTQALTPWIAFILLENWKTAEAAKLVEGWSLDSADIDYLRAYDLAWVSFRKRDYEKARDAIVWAAKNWKSKGTRPAVERDLVLMLARAATPIDQAAAILADVSGGNVEAQYIWLYRLCEGLELAGYPVLAAQALDQALTVLGDKVPPTDRVAMRQRQSTQYLIAHDPMKSADASVAAYEALKACGEACAATEKPLAEQVSTLATHFHSTYSITQDERYYDAAKKLYDFYLTLNREDAEKIRSYLARLDETKKLAAPGSGKHDKDVMGKSTTLYTQALTGCYESVLQGEPELVGSLKLTIQVDHKGDVTGVETDPKAGEEGIAAVAACVDKRAREWKFPGRSKQGTTAVVRTYEFKPKA